MKVEKIGPVIDIKKKNDYKIFSLFCILLFLGTCFSPIATTRTLKQIRDGCPYIDEEMIFYATVFAKTAYLIDKNGTVKHTWTSDYYPGMAVYLLDDGSIIYTTRLSILGAGAGGGLQKITWNNSVVWDFQYYTSDYLSHHDIEVLPNGNILMIAWEHKTKKEAIQAGRDPNSLLQFTLSPDHIIEVKQTGATTGEIVWEWHAWDHLIQDFDVTKDNYGVVSNHPELIDINYGPIADDWLHTNSIDYNEEFDQILISVHNFNEIWVIDHSTTTQEAASHIGGKYGKGGDILYRWGNPKAYRAGTANDQKFFGQHDAQWIKEGCPGEGNILVFNNGQGRPQDEYSSVDEIVPPVIDDGNYFLEPGSAYGPEEQVWTYDDISYAHYISGAQRLENGNTVICNGPIGRFFEVNSEKEVVWEYINPYPDLLFNDVFKITYFTPFDQEPEIPDLDCIGSLNWRNIPTCGYVTGDFQVQNIGGNKSKLDWAITEYPDWGTWEFDIESGINLSPEDGPISIRVNVDVPDEIYTKFQGLIKIENQENPKDFDTIPVYLSTSKTRINGHKTISFCRLYNLISVIMKLKLIKLFFNYLN